MNILAYLDNNATTRLADEALTAMFPYLTDQYLNPSSAAGELFGMQDVLAESRQALARLFGGQDLADGFVLTSGASEANSWAVHTALAHRPGGHLVATAIEHPSMLAALDAQARRGAEVTLIPPGRDGRIDVERFVGAVRADTRLVSVMAANNETGVIQPVGAIAAAVRDVAPDVLIHVDATQAVGRISLDLVGDWAEVDLVSLSAHKFHGPKGVGALFARESVTLEPMIHGSTDHGRRGGTPNPAGAAGLAAAAQLARTGLDCMSRVEGLRDLFETRICEAIPHAAVNGGGAPRLPNSSSITLPGLDASAAVEELATRGVCISTGSACTSGSPAPSHVLVAMGLTHDAARATIRVSLSRATTMDEIELASREILHLARFVSEKRRFG